MKRLPVFVLVMAVLVAIVAGCGRAPCYDRRLAAADSLMRSAPDSALALVEGVCRDSLTAECDRAYRDLLLTQARYRCYVTATSDSDINRALAYYRAHQGEREKLTRAYIYKGAVMEELNHPDSAMLYYKHAEATAAPDDHFNLGDINLRIANLFRIHYADEQIGYERYKAALKHYLITGNKPKQYTCLYDMAMFSGILNNGFQDKYIDEALILATELDDSLKIYDCLELRCLHYTKNDNTLPQAKAIAIRCLKEFGDYINNDLLLDIAQIYVKCGMLDSAKFFIERVDELAHPDETQLIRVRKYGLLSQIAGRTRTEMAYNYLESREQTADTLRNNKMKFRIVQIENDFQEMAAKLSQKNARRLALEATLIFIASTVLMTVLISLIHLRKRNQIKSILKELENRTIDTHDELLAQLDKKNGAAERLVGGMVELIQAYFDSGRKSTTIQEFAAKMDEAVRNAANDNFWRELHDFLNKKHGNIISQIASYPGIKEKDLNFVSLICCGFSYIEISMIMGYSRKYISNKRNYIAKKLSLDMPLQDYLYSRLAN